MFAELNGVVVVDKPAGISSAGVVSKIKKVFDVKRAGHTGTLDPFATGVMVCCINRATRLSRFFLEGDKTYRAVLTLGVETDTQDATGKIIRTVDPADVTGEDVRQAFTGFQGEIQQLPPVYSALKHKGTPLYKLARKGTPVQKPARKVTVYRISIMDLSLPDVQFEIACSSGTYIRTVCSDVGRLLGCGGYLKSLHRTKSCGFSIEDALGIEALQAMADNGALEQAIVPMAKALHGMNEVTAGKRIAEKIQNGVKLYKKECGFMESGTALHDGDRFLKVVDEKGALIAVIQDDKNSGKYDYCCVFPN